MMDDRRDLATALAAVEAWWREAGVDCAFADEPRDWLAPMPSKEEAARPSGAKRRAAAPPPTTHPAPGIGGDRARWPGSLADFAEWWLSEPTLCESGQHHRVTPRGPEQPALMILVAQPEAGDGERLLSGPQGRLLSAILASLGLSDDHVYVASVLPAHVGLVDWPGLVGGDIREVVAHHVSLVQPQRLLVFGRDIGSSLLSNGSAQDSPAGGRFSHVSGEVPLACVAALDGLLERPARKASLWRTLLEWIEP